MGAASVKKSYCRDDCPFTVSLTEAAHIVILEHISGRPTHLSFLIKKEYHLGVAPLLNIDFLLVPFFST